LGHGQTLSLGALQLLIPDSQRGYAKSAGHGTICRWEHHMIHWMATNISDCSPIDTGPRMTKKTMGHRPADSAQAKLKPIRDGSADCDF